MWKNAGKRQRQTAGRLTAPMRGKRRQTIWYFTCHSRLLDDSLREILPEGSNILHFGARFTVTDRHPSREILSYVFRWQIREEELSAALPASPFASRVKERVLAGGTFYEAKGYFPR